MNDDQARNRYFIMNIVRIAGAMFAIVGLASVAGNTNIPPLLGYAILFAGLFGFLAMPRILSKRWRSPPE